MSYSLPPHGLQHARLPSSSPSLGWWQTYVHWVSDAIQSDHLLPSPSPAFSLSQHQDLMQWLHASHQVAKELELQLQHHPSNDYSGLISFRMAWLDLFAVQETLKSLLQHHSSKLSVLWHSDYFTVQLSHLYVTPGKTIALTIQTFVGKVMSLNMLSRFVIAFLPRSKCFLISWLQFLSQWLWSPRK